MKGRHPSPEVLADFVDGSLPDAAAVAVAEHLDSCSACQQLVFAEDKLHQMLVGAADEPLPPPELVNEIIASVSTSPRRSPGPAPAVAVALLGAAAFLFAFLGEPTAVFADTVTVGLGVGAVASMLGGPSGLGEWAVAPGLALLVGVGLVGRHLVSRYRP